MRNSPSVGRRPPFHFAYLSRSSNEVMTGQSVARLKGTVPNTVLTLQLRYVPVQDGGATPFVCSKKSAYSPLVIGRLDARNGWTISFRLGFSLSHPKKA